MGERLKGTPFKDVHQKLVAFGFQPQPRTKGGHVIYRRESPLTGGSIRVPVPDHDVVKVGTLTSILNMAGISRAAWLDPPAGEGTAE